MKKCYLECHTKSYLKSDVYSTRDDKKRICQHTLISLLSGIALALIPNTAAATPGQNLLSNWYVGTTIGNKQVVAAPTEFSNDLNPSQADNLSVDDNSGWKFNIGYDVTDNIAIEAGYMDLNDVQFEGNNGNNALFGQNNSADGFTVSSIYRYSVSQKFGLTGSIGVFSWDGARAPQSAVEAAQENDSGTDFYFGLGGGYQLTNEVTLSVEWERFQLNSEETDVWSIGVDYHFK